MYGAPERAPSQASLPPLESPYLVNTASRASYGKSPSPNERLQILKLQEQVKTYQDDIQKKDKLIEQMSKLEVKPSADKFFDSSRNPCGSTCTEREEVAALNVKLDNLKSQLSEAVSENKHKDETIDSLKRINGNVQEEIARLRVFIDEASKQSDEFGEAKEAFETIQRRNDMHINSLQRQLLEVQEQLMQSRIEAREMESQLHDISKSRDEIALFRQELLESLLTVSSDEFTSVKDVVEKMRTLIFDNESITAKVLTLEEKLKAKDVEQQASRQTITRLVAKLGAEEMKHTTCDESITSLKKELEQVQLSRSVVENELGSSQFQINSLKKEIDLLVADNNRKDKRISELSTANKSVRQTKEQAQILDHFTDELVDTLVPLFGSPSKAIVYEWIVDCVRALIHAKGRVSNLQETVDSLKSEIIELEKGNSNMSQNTHDECRIAINDLKRRLDDAIRNLSNATCTIDTLGNEKSKFLHILTELAQIMKIDHINKDIGFDMIADALYARGTQLQKLEYETSTDHRLTESSLNRKIKELKEKLHSKDLHLDLLHKKLSCIEERQKFRTSLEKERDKEVNSNRKLSKHNQKLQEEIDSLREEIIGLKSQLLDSGQARIAVLSLEQANKTLTEKLNKLENLRHKQSKMLNDFQSDHTDKDKELSLVRSSSSAAIESLNNEVLILRATLEDCRKKEQQMLEFRAIISRLLGLDMDTLAIPDFEIVNRLERLISAHQSNVYTAYSMEAALRDMNQGFYHDPCHAHVHHRSIFNDNPIYPKSSMKSSSIDQQLPNDDS